MSAATKKLVAPRRDYDRRRKRGPIRNKTARPLWRQPMMLETSRSGVFARHGR